jgi:hypothetical protein
MRKSIAEIITATFVEFSPMENGQATVTIAEVRAMAESAALEIIELVNEMRDVEDVSLDDVHHVSEYPDGWDTLIHIPKGE